MPQPIILNINLSKIDKSAIHQGKTGKWLSLYLRPREDEYGNAYMVCQDMPKERREMGEKGPILGNGKFIGRPDQDAPKPTQPKRQDPPPSRYAADNQEDGIPF